MRITLLSHDISDNGLGRAHVLARLLSADHEVEIIGPATKGEIWAPLQHDAVVPIRTIPMAPIAVMAGQADGDLLYSVKERPTSLGVALAARKVLRRPLIADIDDWELGFLFDDAAAMMASRFRDETKWVAHALTDVRKPNNIYRTAWTEQQVRRADAVTVPSSWLAKRFKGTLIEHSRDTSALDPSSVDRDKARAELGISPETTVILFMGSPRRHKGLHNIVAALDLLDRDDIVFLTVGAPSGLPERPFLRNAPYQALGSATEFLGAADMVVLAQEDSPAGRAQMPAKVYDAMAMERPVVVTDVSDLAEAVGDGGLVVPTGDTEALATAIAKLADDPALRAELGATARRRCIANYSDEVLRPRLLEVVDRAVATFKR